MAFEESLQDDKPLEEGLDPAWRSAEESFKCFVRAVNILQVPANLEVLNP